MDMEQGLKKIIMVREGQLSSNHYELVIGGALFPLQKDHYKQTWISPGGSTKHQLDNAPFSKRWRSSLQEVCIMGGAGIDDFVSGHHLLMKKVRIKIPKLKKNKSTL